MTCELDHLVRGATLAWSTSFRNADDEIEQPAGAKLVVNYPVNGSTVLLSIDMTPPTDPDGNWTVEWDSRGANPGTVYWSIYSTPGPAFAVEDGAFILTANPANLGSSIT